MAQHEPAQFTPLLWAGTVITGVALWTALACLWPEVVLGVTGWGLVALAVGAGVGAATGRGAWRRDGSFQE